MSKSQARERWSKLLSEQQSSGLRVSEWCTSQNIDKASFYAWRKRLSDVAANSNNTLQFGASPERKLNVEFVELMPTSGRGSFSSSLILQIGRISVSINAGFDRQLLTDVLDLLESRKC